MAFELCALIVDDSTLIRKNYDATLRKYGFKVYAVKNENKTIDLFLAGAQYDIIFIDMEMSVKDGPQAIRELRAMGVNSMIVGPTSHGQDTEKQAFMEAGLDDCYEKPLTNDIIESLLQKLKDKNLKL